jgi:hypothetical protein
VPPARRAERGVPVRGRAVAGASDRREVDSVPKVSYDPIYGCSDVNFIADSEADSQRRV